MNEWTAERQQIAAWYDSYLSDIQELTLPKIAIGATHVFHLYVVRTEMRDALQAFLLEKKIGTMIHYPIPPHLQKAYKELGFEKGDFPIAEMIAETALSLPLFIGMTKAQVKEVADAVRDFVRSIAD